MEMKGKAAYASEHARRIRLNHAARVNRRRQRFQRRLDSPAGTINITSESIKRGRAKPRSAARSSRLLSSLSRQRIAERNTPVDPRTYDYSPQVYAGRVLLVDFLR